MNTKACAGYRGPSRELELLDQILTDPMAYSIIETDVFAGDRAATLLAIRHMLSAGQIEVLTGGERIKPWLIDAWTRAPFDAATTDVLSTAHLAITDAGAEYLANG